MWHTTSMRRDVGRYNIKHVTVAQTTAKLRACRLSCRVCITRSQCSASSDPAQAANAVHDKAHLDKSHARNQSILILARFRTLISYARFKNLFLPSLSRQTILAELCSAQRLASPCLAVDQTYNSHSVRSCLAPPTLLVII